MRGHGLDPESKVVQKVWAVVRPGRRDRGRFPAGCVEVVETPEQAIAESEGRQTLRPACVAGPSKSSEGQMVYYLVGFLDE